MSFYNDNRQHKYIPEAKWHIQPASGQSGATTETPPASTGSTAPAPATQPKPPVEQPALSAERAIYRLHASLVDLRVALLAATQLDLFQVKRDYIKQAAANLAKIEQLEGGADEDMLQHLRDLWLQLKENPLIRQPDAATSEELLRYREPLIAQIEQAIGYVSTQTITMRLEEWLDECRSGHPLNFAESFGEDLPTAELQRATLGYLERNSTMKKRIALIDLDKGLIYPCAKNWIEAASSALVLGLALAVSTALVWALDAAPNFWKGQFTAIADRDLGYFLSCWAALLAGTVVHVVITNAKKPSGGRAVLTLIATGKFFEVLSAYGGPILSKLLLALLAFYGIIFGPGDNYLNVGNAFLVGYSLDSVADLLSQALTQQSKRQFDVLKGVLQAA